MVSLKLFINQEMCHIDFNGKKRICTVSTYIKEFLSIVEIENKKCQRLSKLNPPVEVISDKLIMFLEGLPTSDSSRQIDHPKCTTLTKGTVVLDVMIQNYFKDPFWDNVIYKNYPSCVSESIKSTFTVSIPFSFEDYLSKRKLL